MKQIKIDPVYPDAGYGNHVHESMAQPIGFVELDVKFAAGKPDPDTTLCANCGWPLGVVNTSTLFVGTRASKRYAHFTCPSLSQRRVLRQELNAREQGQ